LAQIYNYNKKSQKVNMQRLNQVNRQFAKDTSYNGGSVGPKRDDDVVIIGMARTAMTRAKRGP